MDFRQGLARLIGTARGRVKTPLQGMAARCSAALIGGLLPAHGAAPRASLGDDAPVCLIAEPASDHHDSRWFGRFGVWNRPQPTITRATVTIHGLERAPT
jgi:hypothetical protein